VGLARTSSEVSLVLGGSLFATAEGEKGWGGGGLIWGGVGATWRSRGRRPGGRQWPGTAEAGADHAMREQGRRGSNRVGVTPYFS
jgi:hypothetical protein